MKLIFAWIWVGLVLCINGQDVPPAFEKAEGTAPTEQGSLEDPFDPATDAPKLIRVQVEFVEMAQEDLTRLLMDDKPESADATPLRKKVQEMVDAKRAKVIDTQMVLGRSGQKSVSDSLHEFIYPTEYEPINCMPPTDDKAKAAELPKSFPSNPAVPTSFETRNLGSSLESEPTAGQDSRIIDLRILSELVWHTGDTVWNEAKDKLGNVSNLKTPDFYKVSVNTAVICLAGNYTMIAVVSPKDAKGDADPERKVMVFVKCDVMSVIP